MVYRRRKTNRGTTNFGRKRKCKNRSKDLDEINEDIQPEKIPQLIQQELDFDKPGSGQFYCVHCARYFIDNQALDEHFRTKVHKRRMKALETEPYTIEESERAAGFGSYVEAKRRKIATQTAVEVITEECMDIDAAKALSN